MAGDTECVERGHDRTTKSRRKSTGASKKSKKVLHPLFGQDLYKLGREEFAKKDIVAIRDIQRRRTEEKAELRECIMNEIREASAKAETVFRCCENKKVPSWQKAIRRHTNK